jgi:hypothetical protein
LLSASGESKLTKRASILKAFAYGPSAPALLLNSVGLKLFTSFRPAPPLSSAYKSREKYHRKCNDAVSPPVVNRANTVCSEERNVNLICNSA